MGHCARVVLIFFTGGLQFHRNAGLQISCREYGVLFDEANLDYRWWIRLDVFYSFD